MGEDFIPLSMKLITFHPFVKSIEHFEGMTVCDLLFQLWAIIYCKISKISLVFMLKNAKM